MLDNIKQYDGILFSFFWGGGTVIKHIFLGGKRFPFLYTLKTSGNQRFSRFQRV